MTLDQFLLGLDGVRHVGEGQWEARCPAHDDQNASLSIAAGTRGIVLHCHAGCTTEQVCAETGIQARDLFFRGWTGALVIPPARPARPAGGTSKSNVPRGAPGCTCGTPPFAPPEPSADCPFHASKGRVSMPPASVVWYWQSRITEVSDRLYELKGWTETTLKWLGVGFDGERLVFCVREHDQLIGLVRYAPGRTPKTLAVGERNLWPAPDLIAAQHVWLVEGEPDAVSAAEIGLDAIAVPGVGKWRESFTERLRGQMVTICFDCDENGRQAAHRRLHDLHAAGVEAVVVDLDPNRNDGFDLGDCVRIAVHEGRVSELCAFLTRLENEAWASVA